MNLRKYAATFAILPLVLVTGCAANDNDSKPSAQVTVTETAEPGPTTEPIPQGSATDQGYYDAVVNEIPQLQALSVGELADIGRDICSEYTGGLTETDFVEGIEAFAYGTDGEMTEDETAFLFGASFGIYCPARVDELDQMMQGLDTGTNA